MDIQSFIPQDIPQGISQLIAALLSPQQWLHQVLESAAITVSWPAMTALGLHFIAGVMVVASSLFLGLVLVLAIECAAAALPASTPRITQAWSDLTVAVLIPAHNEAMVIQSTLERIQSQLKPSDRLLVIADNCEDDTATLARQMEATVLERHNLEHRGKGYALDFGLKAIAAAAPTTPLPEIVLIIDADCQVQAGAIAHLSTWANAWQRPVQSNYQMPRQEQTHTKDAITSFAARVKNFVRLQGLQNLGLPVLLTGTGMAFPWATLQAVDLASGHLVEDMKLGLDLVLGGHSPAFCATAEVMGVLPQQNSAARSQRTRWEHGRLTLTMDYIPRLIIASLTQRRLAPLLIALDLCVPPLTLVVLIGTGLVLGSLTLGVLGAGWLAGAIATAALFGLSLTIGFSWIAWGQQDLPLVQLLMVPLFMLWKLPIYLKFIFRPQQGWIRTERDASN